MPKIADKCSALIRKGITSPQPKGTHRRIRTTVKQSTGKPACANWQLAQHLQIQAFASSIIQA